jgi:hypothetical protein
MLHYLDDETATAVIDNSFHALDDKGILVTRFVLPPTDRPSWSWRLEDNRIKVTGGRPWYRSSEYLAECMRRAGFAVVINEVSALNPELVWMVCRAEKESTCAKQHS